MNLSLKFEEKLNNVLFDLSFESQVEHLIECIEHIDNKTIKIINEGFVDKYNKNKSLDWYSTSVFMPKRTFEKRIPIIKSALINRNLAKDSDNNSKLLKKFLVAIIKQKIGVMPTAQHLDIEISGGELVRIDFGFGFKPGEVDELPDDFVYDIDKLSNQTVKFKLEKASVGV